MVRQLLSGARPRAPSPRPERYLSRGRFSIRQGAPPARQIPGLRTGLDDVSMPLYMDPLTAIRPFLHAWLVRLLLPSFPPNQLSSQVVLRSPAPRGRSVSRTTKGSGRSSTEKAE